MFLTIKGYYYMENVRSINLFVRIYFFFNQEKLFLDYFHFLSWKHKFCAEFFPWSKQKIAIKPPLPLYKKNIKIKSLSKEKKNMYKKNIKVDKSPNSGHPKTLCRFLHLSSYPEFSPILVSLALIPPLPRTSISDWLLWGKKGGGDSRGLFCSPTLWYKYFPTGFRDYGRWLEVFYTFRCWRPRRAGYKNIFRFIYGWEGLVLYLRAVCEV